MREEINELDYRSLSGSTITEKNDPWNNGISLRLWAQKSELYFIVTTPGRWGGRFFAMHPKIW
jgi:hypothetical protein